MSPETPQHRSEVVIEVRNDAPGLPAEALRLLFDPFVVRSDSPQEYGISLMACYFIARHHAGKIEALANQPQGTIFRLTLPLDPNQPPPADGNRELVQQVLADDAMWEKWVAAE